MTHQPKGKIPQGKGRKVATKTTTVKGGKAEAMNRAMMSRVAPTKASKEKNNRKIKKF